MTIKQLLLAAVLAVPTLLIAELRNLTNLDSQFSSCTFNTDTDTAECKVKATGRTTTYSNVHRQCTSGEPVGQGTKLGQVEKKAGQWGPGCTIWEKAPWVQASAFEEPIRPAPATFGSHRRQIQ